MQYFPLFLRLTDQPTLVVGGGAVAARKVDLLRRAGARVTVVAPNLSASLASLSAQGAIQHIAAEFCPEHLHGMRLVIAATSRQAVNAWVAHQAEARHIPVNVVDDRELSRFIMPAIVDRSPVLVAVSSGGDAPVLTRRLREQLEALLPTRLGALATLAGSVRARVKQRLTTPAARRKFWELFFDGAIASDALAGRAQQAEETIAASLQSAVSRHAEAQRGEVALVGAGPGDPGLLTLRALRALQDADVVLHDRLVSDEILQLARRDAELINVGKAAGDAPISQERINELLIEHAQRGQRVVRLKGGDPFIFGRGGEELQALAAAGVRFEVVPGVTAASGCAAYAGIPLTHRDFAQSITFVTGHEKDDQDDTVDWTALARPAHTVVFYMGLQRLPHIVARLRQHGAPADRAAAVIEQGTQATQRVVVGTLATLPEQMIRERVQSPALLIVGDVARLHNTLSWFNHDATRVSVANARWSAS